MLVPVKFQVILIIISLKICCLSCVVGPTFGTSYGFGHGNLCFLQSNLQENMTKVLHKGEPILYVGDSYIKNGPESKQKSGFNSFRAAEGKNVST